MLSILQSHVGKVLLVNHLSDKRISLKCVSVFTSVTCTQVIQFTLITTPSCEGFVSTTVLAEPETIHGDIDLSFIPHLDVLNFISTFGNKNIPL